MTVGFIGQGYVGKNYANDFEQRGYKVVRYSLEKPYRANKAKIRTCDIVFIAVPTPTKPGGFDVSTVKETLKLVGRGKTAVIKSTLLPGHTSKLQKLYPHLTILFSPEFLSESTAAYDAAHPFSNIVGLATDSAKHTEAAMKVHGILPESPHVLTCSSTEAELIKYAHNGSGYVQVVFFNMMYDLARSLDAKWEPIEEAVRHNPFVSSYYSRPVHKGGRGAGGHCFIKDFAALRMSYEEHAGDDKNGVRLLQALESKNNEILRKSGKDLDILSSVYGKSSATLKKSKKKPSRKKK